MPVSHSQLKFTCLSCVQTVYASLDRSSSHHSTLKTRRHWSFDGLTCASPDSRRMASCHKNPCAYRRSYWSAEVCALQSLNKRLRGVPPALSLPLPFDSLRTILATGMATKRKRGDTDLTDDEVEEISAPNAPDNAKDEERKKARFEKKYKVADRTNDEVLGTYHSTFGMLIDSDTVL